jgi:hypothetical protein
VEDVDAIPWGDPPDDRIETAQPRRCRHPRHLRVDDGLAGWTCACGHHADPVRLKINRNNRKRGNGHEPKVAALYGGEPVGALKLPEDIRGKEYRTQVKTRVGLAP